MRCFRTRLEQRTSGCQLLLCYCQHLNPTHWSLLKALCEPRQFIKSGDITALFPSIFSAVSLLDSVLSSLILFLLSYSPISSCAAHYQQSFRPIQNFFSWTSTFNCSLL
ncbi:hypothetical protein BDW66DRAFT_56127 [Aspergillus desertorum]